jgi:hypothetical protein
MSWRQSPMRDDIEYPLIKSDQRDVFRSILLIKPTVRVGERQMSRLVTRPGPIQPLDVMDTDCSRTYNIFQSCNGNADPYSLHLIQPWPLSPSTRIFVDSICSSTWETCSTLTVTPKEVTSVVSLTKLTIWCCLRYGGCLKTFTPFMGLPIAMENFLPRKPDANTQKCGNEDSCHNSYSTGSW